MSPSPDSLRDLLEREAEHAPHVVVPADTWQRGRRRRRTKAGAVIVAAAAVVAGVLVGPGLLPGADRPVSPAGPGAGLGLPDHLHAPPERMSDQDIETGEWIRDEVRSDLAVGPAAAAWVTPGGLPVVIDAETGEHHLLDLPDVVSANVLARSQHGSDWQPVALSPDGRLLAYGYGRITDAVSLTGIRVVDLVTGELAWDRPLSSSGPVVVSQLTWSRSSEWLGWRGSRPREWTTSSIGGNDPVAGVLSDEVTGPVVELEVAGSGAIAVSDEGFGYALDSGRVTTFASCPPTSRFDTFCVPSTVRRVPGTADVAPGAALSPDGSILALSTYDGYDLVTLELGDRRPTVAAEGMPDDRPWQVSALGWIDDDHVLVLRDDNEGGDGTLSIVPVDTEEGTSTDVGVVDSAVGVPSVAIGLVTLDRPTLDRPDPDWPWSEERWVATVGGGVLAGLALLAVGLLVRLVRRRRAVDRQRGDSVAT
jgi:hypothetical protein